MNHIQRLAANGGDPLAESEGVIELAMPSLSRPYRAQLASTVIAKARLHGYRVDVVNYGEELGLTPEEYMDTRHGVCDGLLLYLVGEGTVSEEALTQPFPIVCMGPRRQLNSCDQVLADNESDARNATELLIGKGSSRLALLGAQEAFSPDNLDAVRGETRGWERVGGMLAALAAHDMTLNERLIGVTGNEWTIGNGNRVMTQLIEGGAPFDGVVALSDQLAIGALFALDKAGFAVPKDVQVIGFDNFYESAYTRPPLTTVDSNLDWIAASAVDLLARRMHETGTPAPAMRFQRESRIVLRGTTR
ncbi:substrate-binding domain-containing protein [Bifidobacterium oedipodis]|uniref:LacI family transcriptional regulator n=1 Tax=Bifidobacterium oedipodis TaxID=2675322 RepID=A0A7Y0HSJ2_9BIFI|nr:substrate-binding domain-containing protein [Bifidobacterium sp. DSM 109957]NMM93062.1 LacI family transcriptional regulator [Bifidobacterium sp. DSM 109957]